MEDMPQGVHKLDDAVGGLSEKTERGRHTTRHTELIPLPETGGAVLDTPGFSFLDTLELDGETYMAFLPADMDENSEDYGIVLLKTVEENGEEMFVTIDDPEELERVHNRFMEVWFEDEEENAD